MTSLITSRALISDRKSLALSIASSRSSEVLLHSCPSPGTEIRQVAITEVHTRSHHFHIQLTQVYRPTAPVATHSWFSLQEEGSAGLHSSIASAIWEVRIILF